MLLDKEDYCDLRRVNNNKAGSLNSFSEQELADCTNSGHYTCNVGGEMSDGVGYIAPSQSGYICTPSRNTCVHYDVGRARSSRTAAPGRVVEHGYRCRGNFLVIYL